MGTIAASALRISHSNFANVGIAHQPYILVAVAPS